MYTYTVWCKGFFFIFLMSDPKCWYTSLTYWIGFLTYSTQQRPAVLKTSTPVPCSPPVSLHLPPSVCSLCLLDPQWWLTLWSKGKLSPWLTFLAPLWSTEILCAESLASVLLLPEGDGQNRMFVTIIVDLIQSESCYRLLLLLRILESNIFLFISNKSICL